MFNRRTVLGIATVALTASTLGAAAQDWKTKYPELVLGCIPAENASTTTDRYAPLADYLSKELGVKVTLRVANEYAAVIEGQRAGNIHNRFLRSGVRGRGRDRAGVPRRDPASIGRRSAASAALRRVPTPV